ncbi:hypothetical protein WJX73_007360 [Symbiochloris irregularis]|uniref:Iron permease FTR1 n=1 Tax=Symbiochloris irregularis TaxID=706552 RepID=A0AAW1P0G0_9CHLO
MADIFSTAALLIMFREALEASVIISIMLQLCERLKASALRKYVWWGALSGVAVAFCLGIVFICLFWVAKNSVFSGEGKIVFEGFLFLLAGWLITILGFAMLKFKNYEKKWEAKIMESTRVNSKKGRSGVFILAFTTTLREGLEAVIFLAGTTAGSSPASIPLPGVIGIIIGLIVGVLLYYTGKAISDIAWFMIIMTVLLFLLGAGLTAHAIVQFQSVNWFGYAQLPLSARPWQVQQIWDWSSCCSAQINKNFFFGLLGTLFGYTEYGTAIWLFAWFGYWIEVGFVLTVRGLRGELTDAKSKYDRRQAALDLEERAAAPKSLSLGPSDGSYTKGVPDAKLGDSLEPESSGEMDPKLDQKLHPVDLGDEKLSPVVGKGHVAIEPLPVPKDGQELEMARV